MERRFQQADIEFREHDDGSVSISGYAAVYYRENDAGTEFSMFDGEVRERITPGAFDRALSEGQDVRALFNHDPNLLLGRSTSGTLRLTTNRRGLQYEIDLPSTSAGKDVAESLRRGDLTGSSFAFRVRGERWTTTDDGEIRELTDVDLMDVGPVTYPAYSATTSGLRDEFISEARDSFSAWLDHKRAQLKAEHDDLYMRAKLASL